MPLPAIGASGLLPPGVHRGTLEDIRRDFVTEIVDRTALREAVFSGLCGWLGLASANLGPGRALVGGGFIGSGEPDERAMVAYLPGDPALGAAAFSTGLGPLLVSLTGVVYSYPAPGGALVDRWAVSGLVDAHLADPGTVMAYRMAFAAVQAPGGGTLPGVTKGIVEVMQE